ncbi:MAG: PorP/SprF family type IX secretion system membrane protein [Bacteroidota bacterium]
MRQFCIIFILTLSLAVSSTAQDKHFTQFYATPMNLNPALTGGFNGTYRFSMIYRDQWRQAAGSAFSSFAGALDLRFPVGINQSRARDAAAVGLMFDTDRVNSVGFGSTGMHFFGAFHKSLDNRSKQYLSAGIQMGLNQRNINISQLTFEDQFNGSTGYTGVTNEVLPTENSFPFADMSVGINYSFSPSSKAGLYVGAAMHHIFEPEISYYFDRRARSSELGTDQLYRRYTAHISSKFPVSNRVSLLPRAVASLQGSHIELNGGTSARIGIGEFQASAVHFGGWVRPLSTETGGINLETAILMVGFETDNVLFGLSYDLSLSAVQATGTGQGVFEFSIAYLGNYDNELVLCPKF